MPELIQLLGWNHLLAILMGLTVWLLCRTRALSRRPALGHGFWLLVLLKLVTPPIVPVPVLPLAPAEETGDAAASSSRSRSGGDAKPALVPVPQAAPRAADSRPIAHRPSLSVACCPEPVAVDPPEAPRPADSPEKVRAANGKMAFLALLGVSLLATCVIALAAARRIWQIRRLLRDNAVDSGRTAELLREVTRLFDLRASVKLRIVDAPVTPMLWAVPGKPAIVLPRHLAEALGDDQLRSIFAHELAHFQRRDHWANLFSLTVASLFWWNPLVWFAGRRRALAAEASCDALALERLGSRKCYAQTLLRVVDSLAPAPPRRLALGIPFGQSRSLKRRFEMIADETVKGRTTRGGWILLGMGLVCLAFVPARGEEEIPSPSPKPQASPRLPSPGTFCCPPASGQTKETPAPADSQAGESDKLSQDERAEVQTYITMFQLAPNHRPKYGYSGIGNLVKSGYWIGDLPIADEQAEAITKLDDVVWGARVNSFSSNIKYLKSNPVDYRDYVDRGIARRRETIQHAQLMVLLGLLTEPQAAFVTRINLSEMDPLISLRDMSTQAILGISESQKQELDAVFQEHRYRFTTATVQAGAAAAMEILTAEQHEMWEQLTTKQTLPAEPPGLPAFSESDLSQIRLKEHSAIFGAIAEKEDELDLSHEQKTLLKKLKKVTRIGLFWISQRDGAPPFPPGIRSEVPPNSPRAGAAGAAEAGSPFSGVTEASRQQVDPIDWTRSEFVNHAEGVALNGILTQEQAEQVWVTIFSC